MILKREFLEGYIVVETLDSDQDSDPDSSLAMDMSLY